MLGLFAQHFFWIIKMKTQIAKTIKNAINESKTTIFIVFIFSFFLNMLYLASPLYMMQIYDRVLHSRSIPTLLFLTILITACFVSYSILDAVRGRVLANISDVIENNLADQLMNRVLIPPKVGGSSGLGAFISRDLDNIRQFSAGPGLMAFMDLPWIPFYLAILFLIHPTIGFFAATACLVQFILAVLGERLSQSPFKEANRFFERAQYLNDAIIRYSDTAKTMGLRSTLSKKWQKMRVEMISSQMSASKRVIIVNSVNKFFSMFFGSTILGVGAWLYINNEVTGGAIFAGSLLLGRAMQPVQQFTASWKSFISAQESFRRINTILLVDADVADNILLPEPVGVVKLENVYWQPDNNSRAVVKNLNFELPQGSTLAVVGPSASGKSTIAKIIAGAIRPTSGNIRVDGADLSIWNYEQISEKIGYLPQDVALFPGKVSENIARFRNVDEDEIVKAAILAHAHEIVINLKDGYNTELKEGGGGLSGGQRQRLGLARAVFGRPRVIILDEPNSNLDTDGERALSNCIAELKKDKCTVVIVTHRLSILQNVDAVLSIKDGSIVSLTSSKEYIEGQISSTTRLGQNIVSL